MTHKKEKSYIKNYKINPFKKLPSLVFLNFFKNNKNITIINKHESHSPQGCSLFYNIKIRSSVGNIKISVSSDYLIKIFLNYSANNKKITTRVPEEALFFLKTNLV